MAQAIASMSADKINYYDDKKHNYVDFWVGRDYEHESELIAINKLLKNRHYKVAMDYGGGYGRLTPTLARYADKVVLVDPSVKQLNLAKKQCQGLAVSFVIQDKKDNVPAKDASIDLLAMIRVSHHLPDPRPVINEIDRVLRPGGEALIEIANEAHFVNRLRYLKHFKAVPKEPVPIGVHANGKKDSTPFVNHNPVTIEQAFAELGMQRISKLSVSNFRHRLFKQHIPTKALLLGERMMQRPLSVINFGPSIFLLFKKPEQE